MTGKEALKKIKGFKIKVEYINASDKLIAPVKKFYAEEVSVIEEELEVLEILKDLINESYITEKISDGVKVGCSNIKEYFINNDFTGKVKRWLENGIHNNR